MPLQAYRDFVDHPANLELRERIDRLVAAEHAGLLSPKQRAEQIQALQDAFLRARFPPGALERIRAKLDATLPGVKKIKVRSSANAEDVPDFDGAGLHDSFAADTGKPDRPSQPCVVEQSTSGARPSAR